MDKDILNLDSLISDMRKKALIKKEEVYKTDNENDKEYIDDIIEFLKFEDSFNKVSKSTLFVIFEFLGYKSEKDDLVLYDLMYSKVMDEANKIYKLVDDEEEVKRM